MGVSAHHTLIFLWNLSTLTTICRLAIISSH